MTDSDTDLDILGDLFLVDDIAQRMGHLFVPRVCVEAVRKLRALASNPDSDPQAVMAAVEMLKLAIGSRNLAAVLTHDLWDDWCPQQKDVMDFNGEHGAVVWAGTEGLVKVCENDDDGLNVSAVWFAKRGGA